MAPNGESWKRQSNGEMVMREIRDRTISIKRAPTQSSPSPLGRTLPNAMSRRKTKSSANSAKSEIFPKMIRASSRVIGGPSDVEDEEPEAVERVRVDEDDD